MPYKDPDRQRQAQREWARRNSSTRDSGQTRRKRVAYVQNLKATTPCMDCHNTWPYYVMQFDHNGTAEKVGGINYLLRYGTFEQVLEEIDKCDLVCGNCHAIRTYNQSLTHYVR